VPDTKEHKRKETDKNRLAGLMNDREGEDLIGRNGEGKRSIRTDWKKLKKGITGGNEKGEKEKI
jgi:hypothetical protein